MKKKRRKQEKMFGMTRRNQNGCIFSPSNLVLACIVGDCLCEAWQKPIPDMAMFLKSEEHLFKLSFLQVLEK